MSSAVCQAPFATALAGRPHSQRSLAQSGCQQARIASRRCLTVRASDPNKVIREFSEETGKTVAEAKQTVQQGRKDNVSLDMKRKMQDEYLGLGGSPNQPLRTNYFVVISVVIASLAILSKLAGYI